MATEINELMVYNFGGNLIRDYLISLSIFIISFVVLKLIKVFTTKRIKKWASETSTKIDDLLIEIVEGLGWPFSLVLSFYIALLFIETSSQFKTTMNHILIITITYYAIRSIDKIIDYTKNYLVKKRKITKVKAGAIAMIIKVVIWPIAIIFILSNMGYNVSALIAGLGIGGIAIGFALKSILDDIFASFSIYFDKPFKPGDFIIIGDDMGTVKKVGIKTTRIKSIEGQELVVSNKELTDTRINNYGRMRKRRTSFSFGVKYETSTKKLRKIPKMIKEIINKKDGAEIDRVHFKKFGDYSLIFEVVYYLEEPDYNFYMDVQQEINLEIKEKFDKAGIKLAYPTHNVIVNK